MSRLDINIEFKAITDLSNKWVDDSKSLIISANGSCSLLDLKSNEITDQFTSLAELSTKLNSK